MGKKRFVLLTLVLALALLLPCGIHGFRLAKIEGGWRPMEGVRFRQDSPASARHAMEEAGIDPAVPGTGGEKLTFSPPMSMTVEDLAGNPLILSRQDVVESDFVSWSHDFRRERMAELTINGSPRFLRLSTTQLNLLYLSALRQNGRGEQFRQDTGRRLGWFSAKSALERLDRQLFAAGLHRPWDYPYDRRRVQAILTLAVLLALPLAGTAVTLISLAWETLRDRQRLREEGRENRARWARVSGRLPRFRSLGESENQSNPAARDRRM